MAKFFPMDLKHYDTIFKKIVLVCICNMKRYIPIFLTRETILDFMQS